MHIILISACEKKSLKRSRAVLDSYAIRAGNSTWMTPITRTGLMELRMMLRRNASKNTAVACYRNDGRKRMKLLWIVGNKRKFGSHGAFPVASQGRKRSPLPAWAKTAALLASSAGYMHDIGKFGRAFQDKLGVQGGGPKADDVRHEWLSMFVVKQLAADKSWLDSWNTPPNRYSDITPFDGHLRNAFNVLLFLVSTHHRLPASQRPTSGDHFNPKISKADHVRDPNHKPTPICEPKKRNMDLIHSRLDKVVAIPGNDDLHYWRALALFSRMALILADHSVSAEWVGDEDAAAYANTDRQTGQMNQDLNWHLKQVGHVAGDMIYKILSLAPPTLTWSSLERIQQRARGRYAWQETAARALSTSTGKHPCPHLIFNMASTGSGKTRMNIRALCELATGKPIRIATALNLRTLTLQTGDAYAEQIGIDRDEMACVIGDHLTKALHVYNKAGEALADDDENPALTDIEVSSDFEYVEAPGWLKNFLDKKPKIANIIGHPYSSPPSIS